MRGAGAALRLGHPHRLGCQRPPDRDQGQIGRGPSVRVTIVVCVCLYFHTGRLRCNAGARIRRLGGAYVRPPSESHAAGARRTAAAHRRWRSVAQQAPVRPPPGPWHACAPSSPSSSSHRRAASAHARVACQGSCLSGHSGPARRAANDTTRLAGSVRPFGGNTNNNVSRGSGPHTHTVRAQGSALCAG